MYKQYRHTLYSYSLNAVPIHMREDVFELGNKKYSWKSIEELETDTNVMSKNDDVIAFVKTKCK